MRWPREDDKWEVERVADRNVGIHDEKENKGAHERIVRESLREKDGISRATSRRMKWSEDATENWNKIRPRGHLWILECGRLRDDCESSSWHRWRLIGIHWGLRKSYKGRQPKMTSSWRLFLEGMRERERKVNRHRTRGRCLEMGGVWIHLSNEWKEASREGGVENEAEKG